MCVCFCLCLCLCQSVSVLYISIYIYIYISIYILQTLQLKKNAERTLKNNSFCVVELVYGLQGIGCT